MLQADFLDNQSLNFTASNWNTAQNVTVFAVKDYIDDGTYGSGDNTTFTVTIDNVSSDNSSDLYDDSTLFTSKALFSGLWTTSLLWPWIMIRLESR